jgi:hypothetical protein
MATNPPVQHAAHIGPLSAPGRSAYAWLALLLLALAVWAPVHAQPDGLVPKEYQIKAAFLFNIPKFVEWPTTSFATASDPIVIGIFGNSPFGDQLEIIVKDRKINGRGIVVKHITKIEDAKTLHLLFLSAVDDKQFAAIKAVIQNSPVLTVGESTEFADAGGAVNFVLVGDKVRFEINMATAELAGLKISSQLQKLATTIRRSP